MTNDNESFVKIFAQGKGIAMELGSLPQRWRMALLAAAETCLDVRRANESRDIADAEMHRLMRAILLQRSLNEIGITQEIDICNIVEHSLTEIERVVGNYRRAHNCEPGNGIEARGAIITAIAFSKSAVHA